MALEKREIEIAKETDDVMVLLIGIVKAAKAKKGVSEIAASELQDFLAAVSGADQIPSEAKSPDAISRTVGMRLGELVAALVG